VWRREQQFVDHVRTLVPLTGSGRVAQVAAVIVTRNRSALLQRCLQAIAGQTSPPAMTFVVDNASDLPLDDLVAEHPGGQLLRLSGNQGPAAAFAAGITMALAQNADYVWLMDDDGMPEGRDCLSLLVSIAGRRGAHLMAPMIRDVDAPRRLAFPIRKGGRTRFDCAFFQKRGMIEGFAHLFNGVLIARQAFDAIGLPDSRLFIRGDEVDFLLRARRAGLRILTDPSIAFLHPASRGEIYPMLGGRLYAVVPCSDVKRFYQFRNRGWIFSRYGMWGWLLADHLRYALYYLVYSRDVAGFEMWLRCTWLGVLGRLEGPQHGAQPLGQSERQPA